jgi:microsomal dipeptidase-like Zn-dependent dipeptidase
VPTKGREADWRELIESTLDEVKRTGGLVGVMFAKVHLDHAVGDVVDQIDLIKARIGVEHIGFGSDANGFVGFAIGDTKMDGLHETGEPALRLSKKAAAIRMRQLIELSEQIIAHGDQLYLSPLCGAFWRHSR